MASKPASSAVPAMAARSLPRVAGPPGKVKSGIWIPRRIRAILTPWALSPHQGGRTITVLETGRDPQTPVDDNLLRRFLHNQAELCSTLAETAGGEVLREPGVVASWYDTAVV